MSCFFFVGLDPWHLSNWVVRVIPANFPDITFQKTKKSKRELIVAAAGYETQLECTELIRFIILSVQRNVCNFFSVACISV